MNLDDGTPLLEVIDEYRNRLKYTTNPFTIESQKNYLFQLIQLLKVKLKELDEAEFLKELKKAVTKYGTPTPGQSAPIPDLNPFCAYEQEAIRRNISAALLLPEDSPWRCQATGLRSSSWDPMTEGGRRKRKTRRRKLKSRRRR
jgi:hypothetical protein